MPSESQDLVFNLKANTSNAEQGMGKINRLTDDLKITTEKTSGALREFGGQLKNARDLSDVAGMATKALGQVLGASLGGTAVLVAGKALIDAFNTVQAAVKETETKVKDAFQEINKAGLPKTFEDGAAQADKLAQAAANVTKKVEEIEASPLQKFIAGITGAREKMEELAASTQKAAQERIKLGVQSAIADEEFQRGLSEKEKALNDLFKSYQQKADKIAASMLAAGADPAEVKAVVDQIYDAHTAARNKMLDEYAVKELRIAEDNARQSSDLRRENMMSEFDLEQKHQDRLRESERTRLNEQTQANLKAIEEEAKRREESAKKIEEYHQRLFDLTEKRISLEERLATSQSKLTQAKGVMAQGAAGLGGSARGAGQRKTSYEIGQERAAQQAADQAKRASLEAYKQSVQDTLINQKYGAGTAQKLTEGQKNMRVSPEAVQIEMTRQRVEAAKTKALEDSTGAIKKHEESVARDQAQLDKVNEAMQTLSKEQQAATEQTGNLNDSITDTSGKTEQFADSLDDAIEATNKFTKSLPPPSATTPSKPVTQPTTSLDDIYDLLDGVLSELTDISRELGSYAHAT